MVIRAATAKVSIPAKGARLVSLLRGSEQALGQLSFGQKCTRLLTLRLVEQMGFSKTYFDDDILAGASGVLQHLAVAAVPQVRDTGVEASLVESALRESWAESLASLEPEGLEIGWDIEEVTDAELGSVNLVYGARRSQGVPKRDEAFCAVYAGHTVVMHGEPRPVGMQDCFATHRRGATLCVDALLKAKQTVTLRRKEGGDIIAGHFDEGTWHRLRLEAELVGVRSPEDASSDVSPLASEGIWKLRFDEDRGWIVADLNDGLGGNSIGAGLQTL
eukprot:gnl/TRDRNA2_/TRDRNA2_94225_c0_seq2.p1 gnl/TRDRNA2_/TRDRNA2_94225_c0~~gnl/TRDRNA2_/TRDRNA2_94225_c0_seq2.p1  ORF type:complete len:275 (-),score=60.21 gnl/TRDRNA2_/TRDRNA2_94225_c0_seq2:77-901(-)